MKITSNKIVTALALVFGLLSLFSVWNFYNWDFLGWGSKLFLFPFLAVIALMAQLSPTQPKWIVWLQLGLMGIHGLSYYLVFNIQDPHEPNLLLLLVPMLLATTVLIAAKIGYLNPQNKGKALNRMQKQGLVLLLLASLCYILLGLSANPQFLLPGICFQIVGLLLYFVMLLRSSASSIKA